ncbi:signal recognition particle-docking protein FtsY [Peptoniphilus sp. KCTC 25270]|uniref:signal recognition particle-docking protein FtsY n=1 Tax=Peptoniphilus sp. KCTC 25270 TaxID=2897414 RepID=UPI001E51C865|nr:signal recognition particle-docking protein FtsY [Peptoniphilus sp. KCTC 25270]MCD1147066.1 signal recognition particle-docking protein FtsY [Peptoniphilus sp. KCTC 25270]
MLDWIKKKFKSETKEEVEGKNLSEESQKKEGSEEKPIEAADDYSHSPEMVEESTLEESTEEVLEEKDELVEAADDYSHSPEIVEESTLEESTEEVLEEKDELVEAADDYNHSPEIVEESTLEESTEEIPEEKDELVEAADDYNHSPEMVEESTLEESTEEVLEEKGEIEKEAPSFFGKLKIGLTKTRKNMGNKIGDILGSYVKIDDEMMEDLEDTLISADIGMNTTMYLIDQLNERIREEKIKDPQEVRPLLADEMRKILTREDIDSELHVQDSPTIILMVGVNGVGKTTTIGKLAQQLKNQNKSVLIAAGDTFRAAAIDQLKTWGQRANVEVIAHQEGADPAAVIFDGVQSAKSKNVDVLICDTAGRLHNKKNLMNELEKINRIIDREAPDATRETLLVLDATTGQNALSQAKTFNESTNLSGIVLTKLDGSAKGGVILPLVHELHIPIKMIGVGEGIDDLQKFNGEDFANALMGLDDET